MYEQTYRRLEKLKSTFDQLVIDNKALHEKVYKRDEPLHKELERLRNYVETVQAREEARERVLKSLSEKIRDQENRESLPPPT